MNTETTRAAPEVMLDAFKRSDKERFAARYHDDIDWLFHAPVALFPSPVIAAARPTCSRAMP